jgi:putative GTP pyrophosphokinase
MPIPSERELAELLAAYDEAQHDLGIFMDGIHKWFAGHRRLSKGDFPVVHSVKSRMKDREHLKEKIIRKSEDQDDVITLDNMFMRITDLAGVRVMHLNQDQFPLINREIEEKIERQKDWVLDEPPKAYTWDPESKKFFEDLGINVEIKESYYTSVHYVVRPRVECPHCCEIQVRTLFEEIWGEVDHALNYPTQSTSLSCREQLKVLAKLVGAGSRLVDSIFRSSETGSR